MIKEINLTFDQDLDLQHSVLTFLNRSVLDQILSYPKMQPKRGELIPIRLNIETWKRILNSCKLDSELRIAIKNAIE